MKVSISMLSILPIALSALALAQTDAQSSFDTLKAMAGTWEGVVTTTPPEPAVEGKVAQVALRVTSMGNALMHELRIPGRPDDPITMLYVEENRLLLTHYCDAGNRPRMVGKAASDGKTFDFNLIDVAGGTKHGHMHGAAFTVVDPDHHAEDWTFMVPGSGPVRAHFDLRRKN